MFSQFQVPVSTPQRSSRNVFNIDMTPAGEKSTSSARNTKKRKQINDENQPPCTSPGPPKRRYQGTEVTPLSTRQPLFTRPVSFRSSFHQSPQPSAPPWPPVDLPTPSASTSTCIYPPGSSLPLCASPSNVYQEPRSLKKSSSQAPRHFTDEDVLEEILALMSQHGWSLDTLFFTLFRHGGSKTKGRSGRSPRHARVISLFLKGQTKKPLGELICLMLTHPDGFVPGEDESTEWSFDDYTTRKVSIRSTLRSFAIQTAKERLVFEAKRTVRGDAGLHASLRKNSRFPVVWADIGVNTVERVRSVVKKLHNVGWRFLNAIAGDDVEVEESQDKETPGDGTEDRERRPPDLVSVHALSALLFARNQEARLLPMSMGLLAMATSTPVDVIAYLGRIGLMPAYSTLRAILIALGSHGKSLIAAHASDPTKAGFLQFDNVQNYLRVRDFRFGRSNTLNIGIAATYCTLEGVVPEALSFSRKLEIMSLNRRASVTAELLYNLIDHQHLDRVFVLHWMRVLITYVPRLSIYKSTVSGMFRTRVGKLPMEAKATPLHPLSSSGKNETVTSELKDALHDFLEQMGVRNDHHNKIVIAGGDGLTFQRVQEVIRYLQFDSNVIESLAHLEPVLASWHTEWTDLARLIELFWDSP
ncbi:hypothetical protein BKA70DRAFT_1314453 [Coprinopsis sp. MPI-PUGE-AT-0042]|nr:hypothetical protein BKA70DRAFT_1314453 [Coprinopsis sp. MPI-PUGE-AT-0042]